MRFRSWRRRGRQSSRGTIRPPSDRFENGDGPQRLRTFNERSSWSAFRPTRPGLRFLLLLLVMGFAAYNTRNNLLYLIFSVGLASVAVSLASGWLTLRAMILERGRARDLYARTVSSELLRLRNPSRWLEGYGVEVEDLDFPGRSPKAALPHLGRGESVSFAIEKIYPRRGIYESHRMRLSTEFPFGLFRIVRRVRLPRQVIVFPRIQRVDISFAFRNRLGQVPQRRRGGESEELVRIRNYHLGDNSHHIHWKATAKLGELMVREFASSEQKSFSVIFDNSGHSIGNEQADENGFETMVDLVASVASHLSLHGLRYRLVTTDESFSYGFGMEHLRGILTYLAVVERGSKPQRKLLDWAEKSLTLGDVVLVLSGGPGDEWSALTSPSLHFIRPEAGATEGRTAHG